MSNFLITVRRAGHTPLYFHKAAASSASAYDLVAEQQGDDVFGITVVPV